MNEKLRQAEKDYQSLKADNEKLQFELKASDHENERLTKELEKLQDNLNKKEQSNIKLDLDVDSSSFNREENTKNHPNKSPKDMKTAPIGYLFNGRFYKSLDDLRGTTMSEDNQTIPLHSYKETYENLNR